MASFSRIAAAPAHLNRKTGEILLAFVILARSTSFLFSKITLETMSPLNLMAIRFLTAFLFLFLLFHKKIFPLQKSAVLRGMILGGLFFGVMALELFSLKATPSSTVSFLENTAIVFVPLFECALRRRWPRLPVLASVSITVLGIAMLTLGGNSASPLGGKLLCMAAAILYAIAIIYTDRASRQVDSLVLGIFQVGFIGFFALCATLLLETPSLPSSQMEWAFILVLALVCTCFGYTLQPVAQAQTTAERAGLFCALSPLGAAVLGHIFLKEEFGLWGLAGAALVLSGIWLATSRKE